MGDRTVDIEREQARIAAITDPTERLIRAGVLALIRSGRAVLDNGMSPELISQAADRSRRSYYDHFRGKRDFTERLIDELLGVGEPSGARIDVAENLIDTNTGNIAETMRTMAAPPAIGNVERVNRIGRQIVTALAVADPYAKARIDDFYGRDRMIYEPLVSQLFESWGLAFRAPWDHATSAVVFRVLVDGIAMRAAVDDSVDETELLLLVLNTLLPAISRLAVSVDHDNVDDLIRTMSDQARYHLQERKGPALVVDSRKAIHDAAEKEITARGIGKTTLFHVAESAQLSVRTIRKSVGEIDEIVCDIVDGYCGGLDNAAEVDLAGAYADDPWSATVRHVHRNAHSLADRGVLVQALANLAITGDSEPARASLGRVDAILVRMLKAAQAAGQFKHTLTDRELNLAAQSGVRLIFRATVSDPTQSAEEALFVLSRCCGVADSATEPVSLD